MEEKFETKERHFSNFTFRGLNIRKKNYLYLAHQTEYAQKLKEQWQHATFDGFYTLRYEIEWIALTWTDICSFVNMLFKWPTTISKEITYGK